MFVIKTVRPQSVYMWWFRLKYMNVSIALKLWGNPTSGSKDAKYFWCKGPFFHACICSFRWLFYTHAFFFFLEFPQPPGGVMTRRTVFTREIITVESVFTRSDWLLYPWYPVLFTSERRQNCVSYKQNAFPVCCRNKFHKIWKTLFTKRATK